MRCRPYNRQLYKRAARDDVFIILRLLLCVHLTPLHQYTTFMPDVSDYYWFSLLSISRGECFK